MAETDRGYFQRWRDLKARFPYQFQGKHMEHNVPKGWLAVFETLCADIDQVLGDDKLGFYWIQCKEKYGTARFYFNFADGTSSMRLDMVGANGRVSLKPKPQELDVDTDLFVKCEVLVDAAEAKTEELCYVCGAPGTLCEKTEWLLTLCPDHAQEPMTSRQMLESGRIKNDDGSGNA